MKFLHRSELYAIKAYQDRTNWNALDFPGFTSPNSGDSKVYVVSGPDRRIWVRIDT